MTESDKSRLLDLCDVYKGKGEISTDNEAIAAAMEFLDDLGNGSWSSTIELGMLDNKDNIKTSHRGTMYDVELVKEIKEEFINLVCEVNAI